MYTTQLRQATLWLIYNSSSLKEDSRDKTFGDLGEFILAYAFFFL